MNHTTLTTRYRPQTFAEAAGQETLRAVLSRAAAEDRVASAYLFSGTRGVGKTTFARVFAKALNCMRAPAAEPCNACERCRQITLGTAVDVVEIDGASNRGIDDVRRLKEVVGYAPMDGRYKVFIIDEAHMLSREAFNALLKTLEEPPAKVTFIMATTEVHKFPATILSRCQHYVFKRLTEPELENHLTGILRKEKVPFDEAAVRLIARRAAGSVRDGMSLLGQVLALGGERLTEADARKILGLAGQEFFFRLFAALQDGDSLAVVSLVREMLDRGLDLGFFLRELVLVWRCLFMFKQAGEAAISVLDLSEAEARRWLDTAAGFSLTHVHAAWQMALDGQRRVLTSLEPALALELLLLNLALLPRLLPVEHLSGGLKPSSSGVVADGRKDRDQRTAAGQGTGSSAPVSAGSSKNQHGFSGNKKQAPAVEALSEPGPGTQSGSPALPESPCLQKTGAPAEENKALRSEPENVHSFPGQVLPVPAADPAAQPLRESPLFQGNSAARSWDAFMRHIALQSDLPPGFSALVRELNGELRGNDLVLRPAGGFTAQRLSQPEILERFHSLAGAYYGDGLRIVIQPPPPAAKGLKERKKEVQANPSVQMLMQEFNARLIAWDQSVPENR